MRQDFHGLNRPSRPVLNTPAAEDNRDLPCEVRGPLDKVHEQWRYEESVASDGRKPRHSRPG